MTFSRNALLLFSCATIAITATSAFAFAPTVNFSPKIKVTHSVSLASIDDLIANSGATDNTLASPEDFIVNAGELDNEPVDPQSMLGDDSSRTSAYDHQSRVTELRVKYRRDETDTGSSEYQIAGISERINYLTEHMRTSPKDFSTRRGLVALVNKRRRLLNYLFTENVQRYSELVNALGIRHKAPSRVQSKEDQYGRFPGSKDPMKYKNKLPKTQD